MSKLITQRVYDSTAGFVYYTKNIVDPTPLSGETAPNHTDNLVAGTHLVVSELVLVDFEVVIEAGTTRTLDESDRNRLIICAHEDGCTVTIPDDTLPAGWRTRVVQGHVSGRTILVAGGAAIFRSIQPPETGGIGTCLEITIAVSPTPSIILVDGDRTQAHVYISDAESPYTVRPNVDVLNVDNSSSSVEIIIGGADPGLADGGYGPHSLEIIQWAANVANNIQISRAVAGLLINGEDVASLPLPQSNLALGTGERRAWQVVVNPTAPGLSGEITVV